jgi:protein-disulfide isomerase
MFRNIFPSLVLFALAIGGSYLFVQSRAVEPQFLADLDLLVDITDVQATNADAPEVIEMTLGDKDAPVTVIEYASFTCPHCADFHTEVFGRLKSEYVDTGKVYFIMRDVYFDRFGLWAAMVARCDGPEKFFGVSDLIYRQQNAWTDGDSNRAVVENLMEIGRAGGMTDEAMNTCLQDNAKAQALVATYQKNADEYQIASTPSFVINGKLYPNLIYAEFKTILDDLLTE